MNTCGYVLRDKRANKGCGKDEKLTLQSLCRTQEIERERGGGRKKITEYTCRRILSKSASCASYTGLHVSLISTRLLQSSKYDGLLFYNLVKL